MIFILMYLIARFADFIVQQSHELTVLFSSLSYNVQNEAMDIDCLIWIICFMVSSRIWIIGLFIKCIEHFTLV